MANSENLRVLVVVENAAVGEKVERYLAADGAHQVTVATNGADAWDLIIGGAPELVVLGWRLEAVSGLALLNRMRATEDLALTPALVVSSALDAKDFRLFEELPCVADVPGTLGEKTFLAKLQALREQAAWYRSQGNVIAGTLDLLDDDGRAAARKIIETLRQAPDAVPIGVQAARLLQARGWPEEAEKLLRFVLGRHPDSVATLMELGKLLYRKGRTGEALPYLERAHQLSPQNLQRLCLVGAAQLAEGQGDAARSTFEAARALDATDPAALAGLELVTATTAGKVAPPTPESLARSFASILNGGGIALVRNRRFAEGIRQYQAVMGMGFGDDVRARVAFNIGLAYLRWGKKDQATPWLQQAADGAGPGFEKARGVLDRVLGRADVSAAVDDMQWIQAGGPTFAMDADWLAEETIAPAKPRAA